ncbi:phosphatidylglycerophosphatase A [Candidatus Latescibacterota bacterium]
MVETQVKLPDGHPQKFMDHAAVIFSSCLYTGYLPVAPGTWGSLWGPVLYYLFPAVLFPRVLFIAIPVLVLTGALAATRCERFWGSDPSRVVVDEVAGILVTYLFLPVNGAVIWIGFFLFRLFDIVKPPPARQAERLPGGWGVMADDVLAGIYANLSLWLLILLFPGLAE